MKIQEKRNPKTGKPVTVVSDIKHNPQVIENLEKKLKTACGAGGFSKGKTISIHGPHLNRIKDLLVKDGFEVKVI